MKLFFLIGLTLGIVLTSNVYGQPIVGVQPSVLLGGPLQNDFTYHLLFQSEAILSEQLNQGTPVNREIITNDFAGSLAYQFRPEIQFSATFLFRLRDPYTDGGNELRPQQIVVLTQQGRKIRIRHRFRLEQRWIKSTRESTRPDFDFRLRYRLSTDLPLNGERLDVGEWYLNINSEVLLTPTQIDWVRRWDYRIYNGIGYQMTASQRIEPGIELRTREDISGHRQNRMNFRLTWISHFGK